MIEDFEVIEHVDETQIANLRKRVDVDVPLSLHWTWEYGSEVEELRRLYEKRKVSAADAIKEMEASFAHLKKVMQAVPASSLSAKQKIFGSEMTGQQLWILTATHLHEHLGQMIAYARSNGVVPPWSK